MHFMLSTDDYFFFFSLLELDRIVFNLSKYAGIAGFFYTFNYFEHLWFQKLNKIKKGLTQFSCKVREPLVCWQFQDVILFVVFFCVKCLTILSPTYVATLKKKLNLVYSFNFFLLHKPFSMLVVSSHQLIMNIISPSMPSLG